MKLIFFIFLITCYSNAQDSSAAQDAIYNRPFIFENKKTSTAIGGYLEANSNYFSVDGVSEGFSMEMRRFNIFLFSTIIPRVKFLAELEFEHGTEEIALETAQVDIEFNPALVLRAGIIVVPIGAFNQNHDSPNWEFIERPLVATEIIPSTLSEVGFGFNGKFILPFFLLTYDAYLFNGLTDGIILNKEGRTFFQSGKSEERLAEDNNGSPSFSSRIALKTYDFGEIGLSYYGGIYNSYKIEGETVDEQRMYSIMAVDFNTRLLKTVIQGEFALNTLDVPPDIDDIFGKEQWGGYLEIIHPLISGPLFGFEKSVINGGLRMEYVDYNTGDFASTGKNIFDDVRSVSLALSYRPSQNTAVRANYMYQWIRDALGNPTVKNAGFQFGIASYF